MCESRTFVARIEEANHYGVHSRGNLRLDPVKDMHIEVLPNSNMLEYFH